MKENQEIMDELPFRYAMEFYKCESGVYAKRWIRHIFNFMTHFCSFAGYFIIEDQIKCFFDV